MIETLLLQLSGLPHWKICAIATWFLLQGAVFTIFPEEVIVTTLGVLWSQQRVGFFEAMLAVQLGLLPANLILVTVGNKLGPGLFEIRPFRWLTNKRDVEDALRTLKRHGAWVVFITRFVPLIRGPIYFAAGLSRLRPLYFFKIDASASFIQIPLLLLLGGTIGRNSGSLISAYQKVGLGMAGLLGIGALFAFLRRRKKSTLGVH